MTHDPETTLLPDESDPTPETRPTHIRRALILFIVIAIAVVVDIVHDSMEGAAIQHLVVEAVLMAVAISGAVMFWRFWLAERLLARRALAETRQAANAWRDEAVRWRQEARAALDGLASEIDRQFERWELTGAEREVAMLLLKGLSFQEIAAARTTSERTARQQAGTIYKKAELAGRAELSAFFLEDLLVQREDR